MIESKGAYKSPGHKHRFNFIFEGEIRFGPSYYKVELDGQLLSERIFGFEYKWHPESKYLALQEWLTTDYQNGPITALTLIDLDTKMFARISMAEKGFIKPIRFEKDLIIFQKEFMASGKTIELEIKLSEIDNWE